MESGQVAAAMASNMKLDEKSIEMLDRLKKRFPPVMSGKVKIDLLDKLAMHGAHVCRQRGDTTVSIDDILVGAHQSLAPGLINLVFSRLGISPERSSDYKQKALDLDYVSVDTFLRDTKVIAEKCGAKVCEDRLRPILDCYRDIVESSAIYIKTTDRDLHPRELYVRPGHPGRWFDLAAMAKDYGLADFYDNPAYQAYASICGEVNEAGLGSMVDISVQGDILKLYAFLTPNVKPLDRIKGCKNLPDSIFENSALLESWGFTRFGIFGVNLRNSSANFYYYIDPAEFGRDKIVSILSTLDFEIPSAEVLEQMKDAVMLYFTFTHASDQIERVCFTRIYEDSMVAALELAPSLKNYIEESPIQSAKRNLLLGFTFDKRGHYLKAELDYKASLYVPGKMKYSGLYSN